jgi:hypothetical protein
MIDRPDAFRGDLCRVSGELLQHRDVGPPYEDVSEWFIRDSRSKRPMVVYVVRSESDRQFSDHDSLEIDGRFYKRLRFQARDGQVRDYPALVGRFPRSVITSAASAPAAASAKPASGKGDRLWMLAGLVVMLLVAFVALRLWIARMRRGTRSITPAHAHLRSRWREHGQLAMDEPAGLPDDPAEALAEMRRQARGE